MAVNRDKTGKFVKGNKSGGRKAIPDDVKEMLKAATVPAVELLVGTMQNKEEKSDIRVRCAETILDRVYGKATQPIEANTDNRLEIIVRDVIKNAD